MATEPTEPITGSLILDSFIKRIYTAISNEPVKVEIRNAPKRANGSAYISLTPIGVKPGHKIIVITFKDTIIVSKFQRGDE